MKKLYSTPKLRKHCTLGKEHMEDLEQRSTKKLYTTPKLTRHGDFAKLLQKAPQ